MAPEHAITRRRVLEVSGTALAAGVGVGTASADHSHADVETDPATNVDVIEPFGSEDANR